MSIYDAGIDIDKACLLIALDNVFGNDVDWGKEFLIDLYKELGEKGFPMEYDYLIEECAPVKHIFTGTYTFYYTNNRPYVHIYDRENSIRYRVSQQTLVIFAYNVKDTEWHVVAIPASQIGIYFEHHKFGGMFIPTQGLIVDNRTYEQDAADGIIIEKDST